MMQVKKFLEQLHKAEQSKTLYVMGCFGAPMTASNKTRYKANHSYNKATDRQQMIDTATADTFGFDCVCLIKGILWGWDADASKSYGGAVYKADGVPDYSADQLFQLCDGTKDFSKIQPGWSVWMSGHIGVYVGDGLVIECSPKWENGVQITACSNIEHPIGYNSREWSMCGPLPFVDYSAAEVSAAKDEPDAWAKPAWDWCASQGITDGTRPRDPLTRQEAMQLIYNVVHEGKGR